MFHQMSSESLTRTSCITWSILMGSLITWSLQFLSLLIWMHNHLSSLEAMIKMHLRLEPICKWWKLETRAPGLLDCITPTWSMPHSNLRIQTLTSFMTLNFLICTFQRKISCRILLWLLISTLIGILIATMPIEVCAISTLLVLLSRVKSPRLTLYWIWGITTRALLMKWG